MSDSPKDIALRLLATLTAKDLDGVLALLAPDASLYDPHYPSPLMTGHDAIRGGTEFVFGFLRELHWTVLRTWENADSVVLEVDTAHVLPDGSLTTPKQVFVVDVADGKITNWRSYVPYPPPPPPA